MADAEVDEFPLLHQRATIRVSLENGIDLQGPWRAGQEFGEILSVLKKMIEDHPPTGQHLHLSHVAANKLRLVNLNFSLIDTSVLEALEVLSASRLWSRVHIVWCSGNIPTSLLRNTRRLEIYGGGPHWQNSSRPLWEALGTMMLQEVLPCPLRVLRVRSRFDQGSMGFLTSGLGSPQCSLDELHFTSEFVDAESAMTLAEGLRTNRRIRRLAFLSCEFYDEITTGQILLALQNHPTLNTLEVQDNNCLAMSALSALVESSTCPLETLNLYHPAQIMQGAQVPRVEAQSLSLALQHNTSLKHLILASNGLDAAAIASLAEALKVNTTLQKLDLTGNAIDDDGIETLAAVLPEMKGLKELLLSNNDFGGRGARALTEGMKTNVICQSIVTFNKFYASKQLEFYLHLNQAGRRILRHENVNSVPLSLWPLLLSRINLRSDWDKSEMASSIYGLLLEGGHQQLFD